MSFGYFICLTVDTLLIAITVDFFQNKSDMTVPYLLVAKALIDIPTLIMTYLQQSNFILSITGVFL
jgi:hypothetical protein